MYIVILSGQGKNITLTDFWPENIKNRRLILEIFFSKFGIQPHFWFTVAKNQNSVTYLTE